MKMQHLGIRFHTHEPDCSDLPLIDQDWFSVCGNVQEEMPQDAPPALGKPVQLTHCVDANLMHDILTGGSVTACLHFINATPLDWHSNEQSALETATHSSEFFAARTCIEQTIDLQTAL